MYVFTCVCVRQREKKERTKFPFCIGNHKIKPGFCLQLTQKEVSCRQGEREREREGEREREKESDSV